MKHKRREAPVWVFPWRGLRESPLPKFLAILLTGTAFALFLTSVRIRVAAPAPWASRKAAVIQVLDDADGRSLTLRAREGGPFPSRFDPAEWELAPAIERVAYQAARWRPAPYVPTLRDLSDDPPPLRLASPGAPVLPSRQPPANPVPVTEKLILAPRLHPLSGITAKEMPDGLPPFAGEVEPAMAAEPWRFLLRLDATGRVLDCVSLTGGEPGKPALEAWLRGVSFQPKTAKPTCWIAVGLSFANQATDGTDAR